MPRPYNRSSHHLGGRPSSGPYRRALSGRTRGCAPTAAVNATGPVMLLYVPPVISWLSSTAPHIVLELAESTCAAEDEEARGSGVHPVGPMKPTLVLLYHRNPRLSVGRMLIPLWANPIRRAAGNVTCCAGPSAAHSERVRILTFVFSTAR